MSETSETSETSKTSETSDWPEVSAASMQTSKNNKITAVEKSDQVGKTERTKDPRKVELGKRLAKISKEAKERKAKHREAAREAAEREVSNASEVQEINNYLDFRYLVGGVTIVAALGGLYYAYKNDTRLAKRERFDQSEQSDRPEVSSDEVFRTTGPATKMQEENTRSEKVKTININDYEITKCKPSTSKSCIENLWKFVKNKIWKKFLFV